MASDNDTLSTFLVSFKRKHHLETDIFLSIALVNEFSCLQEQKILAWQVKRQGQKRRSSQTLVTQLLNDACKRIHHKFNAWNILAIDLCVKLLTHCYPLQLTLILALSPCISPLSLLSLTSTFPPSESLFATAFYPFYKLHPTQTYPPPPITPWTAPPQVA